MSEAVRQAKEKLGYLHKISVEVTSETELKEAIGAGADVVILEDFKPEDVARLVKAAKDLSEAATVECSVITLENVREFAEAGASLLRIEALTSSAPARSISFKVQPY